MGIIIVPGLHGSGPDHWQTWFESCLPETRRVIQADWSDPQLLRWSENVQLALRAAREPVWIVAHSFGSLASAHAAHQLPEQVAGLMLVAPADPEKFGVTSLLPTQPFPCPSIVVGSRNDPWMPLARSLEWAERWQSRFVDLGEAGHINTASGFGAWPQGLDLFRQLQTHALRLPHPAYDFTPAAGLDNRAVRI